MPDGITIPWVSDQITKNTEALRDLVQYAYNHNAASNVASYYRFRVDTSFL